MAVLYLNLFKKWFDEIASGRKREEYRDMTDYWRRRLFDEKGLARDWDYIIFRNGYRKDAPEMKVEFKGLRIDKRKKTYVILLGEIIEIKNKN